MARKKVPGWLNAALLGGAFAALFWWERRRPLRHAVENKNVRTGRNLTVAALSAAAIRLAEKPFTDPLSALVERRRWGLVPCLHLPAWLEVPLAVALLDYTLYVWHVLAHRVPWLWRFHVVHHVDLDLDASTALRFHFGEMVASVPWRVAQVVLIGVSPAALSVWQTLTLMEIMFHHSNVELPVGVERWLCRLIVTPRMHGIHHSIVPGETNTNWSSGLTLWDALHGTLQLNVPQAAVTVGVPAYRAPAEVTLPHMLALPFERQRPSDILPGDGTPTRLPLPVPPDRLLA